MTVEFLTSELASLDQRILDGAKQIERDRLQIQNLATSGMNTKEAALWLSRLEAFQQHRVNMRAHLAETLEMLRHADDPAS